MILAFVIESIIRFLVPQREKRPYVLVFYSLASIITVVCLIDSFYFAFHPKQYLYSYGIRNLDKKSDEGVQLGHVVNLIQADMMYALIEFVTFKMYHLCLTLRFIFADPLS